MPPEWTARMCRCLARGDQLVRGNKNPAQLVVPSARATVAGGRRVNLVRVRAGASAHDEADADPGVWLSSGARVAQFSARSVARGSILLGAGSAD
jgi:hypothetical protein